jgi:hypothetical protein
MRIARKFKQLTRYTYPYGTEKGLLPYLPIGYIEDGMGNYYLQIGDKPSTMFSCHLDTSCSIKERVTHIQDGNIIGTNGKTILGADDKAGMIVILYMIEQKIPGLYYFFEGEEVGCVGSTKLSNIWEKTEFSKYIKKVVSFDRRGTDSVITEQLFGKCCSDEFATDLSNKLNETGLGFNFSPDPTGIFTDSAKFVDLVPECTNISVGYYNEHTTRETQDIDFLRRLCKAVCMIDWESLPIVRDHNLYYDYDYEYHNPLLGYDKDDLTWSDDNYSFFEKDGKTVKLFISNQYVDLERRNIYNWLITSGLYSGVKNVIWNGNSLYVETKSVDYVGDRSDLIDFFSELSSVPSKHTKSKISREALL